MIGLTQREVISLILNSFLCGVCFGVIYDFVRAFKMLCGVRYGNRSEDADNEGSRVLAVFLFAVTVITDVVFWVAAGVASIILIYGSGGVFRGLTYFCMAAGFLFYYFTLGSVVLKLNKKLTDIIKKILGRVARAAAKKASGAVGGIISLYHLTIGRIFDKILDSVKHGSEKKQESLSDVEVGEDERGEEDVVYVDGGKGYRREGRISFGKRE